MDSVFLVISVTREVFFLLLYLLLEAFAMLLVVGLAFQYIAWVLNVGGA